jgi:hypothetical protein
MSVFQRYGGGKVISECLRLSIISFEMRSAKLSELSAKLSEFAISSHYLFCSDLVLLAA